jgi:hypothetical protein
MAQCEQCQHITTPSTYNYSMDSKPNNVQVSLKLLVLLQCNLSFTPLILSYMLRCQRALMLWVIGIQTQTPKLIPSKPQPPPPLHFPIFYFKSKHVHRFNSLFPNFLISENWWKFPKKKKRWKFSQIYTRKKKEGFPILLVEKNDKMCGTQFWPLNIPRMSFKRASKKDIIVFWLAQVVII